MSLVTIQSVAQKHWQNDSCRFDAPLENIVEMEMATDGDGNGRTSNFNHFGKIRKRQK